MRPISISAFTSARETTGRAKGAKKPTPLPPPLYIVRISWVGLRKILGLCRRTLALCVTGAISISRLTRRNITSGRLKGWGRRLWTGLSWLLRSIRKKIGSSKPSTGSKNLRIFDRPITLYDVIFATIIVILYRALVK